MRKLGLTSEFGGETADKSDERKRISARRKNRSLNISVLVLFTA